MPRSSTSTRIPPAAEVRTPSALLLAAAVLASCGGLAGGPPGGPAAEPESDRLSEARLLLSQGDKPAAFAAFLRLAPEPGSALSALEGAVAAASGPGEREEVAGRLAREAGSRPGVEGAPFRALLASLDADLVAREERLRTIDSESAHLAGWPRALLGDIHVERGSLDAALETYESALRSMPGLARAHLGRARMLLALGRPLAAAAAYESYLQVRPRDAAALYNLGWIILTRRDSPRDARPYLERAHELLPGDVPVLIALGTALMTDGDARGAEPLFLEAARRAPDDPDVHWNLGVLYADHLDDRGKAVQHFERALEAGGTPRERILEAIRAIRGGDGLR